MTSMHYFCPLCPSSNLFHDYARLFTHIRNEHREESLFTIRCELSVNCRSRYTNFDSYRRHIYRCHRPLIDSINNSNTATMDIDDVLQDVVDSFSFSIASDEADSIADCEPSIYTNEEIDEINDDYLSFDPISLSATNQEINFEKLAEFYTRFLLELREGHLLPQKVVQLVSSNIRILLSMIVSVIKTKASSSFISVTDFETTFINVNRIINSISQNEYQFLKQCEKHFGYQPPTEIVLNTTKERAYYIPLKQSLSCTFQNGQLLQAIINNIDVLSTRADKDKDLILSNRQSRSVKTNISRQTNSNALLLKLYTDGISVTNPIGAKKDSHKFTCFYYLLDDLPEVVRSQVNSIGLHSMCYTKHLNEEGSRTIFLHVLVEDLNKLKTEGITIPCLSSRIYFVFSTLSGDNLAAHEVGGFQRNFDSGSFCRHCFVTYEQRHIPLTDISFVTRTRSNHDLIVTRVVANDHHEIIQGVRCYSWFKDLIGFHPTESLPPDGMHDFAEGVCPLIICALLKEAIQQRLLSYSVIEDRTSFFVFGFNDLSNKPPPVKRKHLRSSHIVGTASQKLCFFRFFPVIFYDIIDDLTLFPLYIILREIISYVYAYPIRKSWVPYLDGLCKQFHSLMIERLPHNVTPKVHYITEYSRSIERHGLPILNTCMRFEAKHQYFKQIAIQTFNFKNPLLTLCKRHQLRQCIIHNSNLSSISSSVTFSSSKSIQWTKLAFPVRCLLAEYADQSEFIFECVSLYYNHINIRQDSIFVDRLVHAEEIPVFRRVHHLLNIMGKWIVVAEELRTLSFNEKLWSFEVEFTGTLVEVEIQQCFKVLPHCLDAYIVEQASYINVLSRLTEN